MFELVPKNGKNFFLLYKPQVLHLEATKRVIWYLKGTIDYGIFFWKGRQEKLEGFIDVDWASDQETKDPLLIIYFVLGLVQSFGAICDNQWLFRALQKRSIDLWHKEERILHG